MAVMFKLTKANGATRRITFESRPTWPLLSTRIATLYDIAIQNIGVSYVDSDGDDVTLSSDEELQDFYSSSLFTSRGVTKFAVHDLNSLRAADTTSHSIPAATPQQSHFRNTFGGHEVLPIVFDAEDEWQRLPGNLGSLFLSRDAPESPHAFVEVLESDVSVSKSQAAESVASLSDHTFTPTASQNKDKGKGRAFSMEDDVSSAGSVIGGKVPAKPPVHVFDVSSEDLFGRSPMSTVQLTQSGATTPAQAQSTPVIPEQPLKVNASPAAGEQKTEIIDDDPPLPSLDLPDLDRAPSLAHDIAGLLTTISTVFSTHPELSQHFRNIVTNSTNGTYWIAHRDAISRAAENLHRSAIQETGRNLEELRRATEQEASVRVNEALGTIFRALAEFVQVGQQNTTSQAFRNTTQGSADETTPDVSRQLPNAVPSPPRFPYSRHNHHSWFGRSSFVHPAGPIYGGLAHPHPPPPPPPHLPIRGWPRPPPHFWGRDTECPEVTVSSQEAKTTMAEVLAPEPQARVEEQARPAAGRASSVSTTEATPAELLAEVERAKADYKARKERYRQARSMKKMAEKYHDQGPTTESLSRQTSENTTPVTPDSSGPPVIPVPNPEPQAPTPDVHIVSNARGRYPQLEMFSVPRRSHTTAHMLRGRVHENKENRPYNRIMKKLSDMGFTESVYPNLTGKVMDQLLSHPPVTKDAEDDIVTSLIEELIPSGGGAGVGGSGGIPGAWH